MWAVLQNLHLVYSDKVPRRVWPTITVSWPPRSKVKVISSHRLYVSSLPLLNSGKQNAVPVSLECGGGIPCWPHLAATLFVTVTSASDLPLRTIKFWYILFGLSVDWYKQRRAFAVINKVHWCMAIVSPSAVINFTTQSKLLTALDTPAVFDPEARFGRKSRFLRQLGGQRRYIAIPFGMETRT